MALLLTISVELPLVLWLINGSFAGPGAGPRPLRDDAAPLRSSRVAVVVLGANLVSHPLLWFVGFPLGVPLIGWAPTLWVSEVLVVAFEALVLWRYALVPAVQSLLVSTVANGASLLIGLVLALVL